MKRGLISNRQRDTICIQHIHRVFPGSGLKFVKQASYQELSK